MRLILAALSHILLVPAPKRDFNNIKLDSKHTDLITGRLLLIYKGIHMDLKLNQ